MPSRMMNDRTELAGRVELLAAMLKDGDYEINPPTFKQLENEVDNYLKLLLPEQKKEPKIDYLEQSFDDSTSTGSALN